MPSYESSRAVFAPQRVANAAELKRRKEENSCPPGSSKNNNGLCFDNKIIKGRELKNSNGGTNSYKAAEKLCKMLLGEKAPAVHLQECIIENVTADKKKVVAGIAADAAAAAKAKAAAAAGGARRRNRSRRQSRRSRNRKTRRN